VNQQPALPRVQLHAEDLAREINDLEPERSLRCQLPQRTRPQARLSAAENLRLHHDQLAILESPYFVSSTFAGETLSLSACVKTLELLQNKYKIELLWEKGLDFLSKFNALWPEGVALEGYPTRSKFIGDEKNIALFMQECCKAGILVGPSFFLCFPHLEILDEVLSTFKDILTRIRLGEIKLEGEMPKKPYAESVRGKS
jgi:hypothetical protein